MAKTRRQPKGPAPGNVWEVGTAKPRIQIQGQPAQPTILMAVEAATGHAFPPYMGKGELAPQEVRRFLIDTRKESKRLGLAPLKELRTAEPLLERLLAQTVRARERVVQMETPQLDQLRDGLEGSLAARGAPYTYGLSEGIEVGAIKRLFEAARRFRSETPWELLAGDDPLHLEIPSLEIEALPMCVVEDGGLGGLTLFLRHESHLEAMADPHTLKDGLLNVMFFREHEVSEELQAELDQLRFIKPESPYPVLARADSDGPEPLTPEHYQLATIALEAVSSLASRVRDGRRSPGNAFWGNTDLCGYRISTTPEWGSAKTTGDQGTGPSPCSVHQLKVTLRGAKPTIWRRIEVPSSTTLGALHQIIQFAMGWEMCHLHQFEDPDGAPYGDPDELDDSTVTNEEDVQLWMLAGEGAELLYEYDFGDAWVHLLEIEKVSEASKPLGAPRCIEGQRACPPEDCGGVPGYGQLLEVLKNGPKREKARLLEWLDDDFDPAKPGLEGANRVLKHLFNWDGSEAGLKRSLVFG